MLKELTISNYALIDYLKVDLSQGFTSITGETGAGKSIILGGLSLALGKRADPNLVMDKTKKCYLTGKSLSTFSLGAMINSYCFETVSLNIEPICPVEPKRRIFIENNQHP